MGQLARLIFFVISLRASSNTCVLFLSFMICLGADSNVCMTVFVFRCCDLGQTAMSAIFALVSCSSGLAFPRYPELYNILFIYFILLSSIYILSAMPILLSLGSMLLILIIVVYYLLSRALLVRLCLVRLVSYSATVSKGQTCAD